MALRLLSALLAALALCAVLPGAAQAARFEGHAAERDQPTHQPESAYYRLYFTDRERARTAYRLCAWRGAKRLRCRSEETRAAGRAHAIGAWNLYRPARRMRVTWRWYVGGAEVASWRVMSPRYVAQPRPKPLPAPDYCPQRRLCS